MKIVFLRSNPVNPDPRVQKEVNSLLKEKHVINILAWDRDKDYSVNSEKIKMNNGECKITRFGIRSTFGAGFKKNLMPLIRFQICLLKWLIKNRGEYDIIHACDFDTVIPAYVCKKLFGKKYIYDIFDYYVDAYSVPNKIKGFIQKIDHIMINNSDATIICTEERRKQIKGASPKKIEVIHNSPNKFNISNNNNLKLNEDKVKIVYVGILNDGRYIIELAEVIKDMEECEFHIGGFGKLENQIRELASRYPNIKFYGKLPYDKTLELESQCDIMTAIYDPSISNHYYAAPNKFYEALMLGKPLIMIKNTGMDKVISENKIGEVTEFNKQSIEKAIKNIIANKDKWQDISKKMKEIYDSEYSWDIMEKRIQALYKDI